MNTGAIVAAALGKANGGVILDDSLSFYIFIYFFSFSLGLVIVLNALLVFVCFIVSGDKQRACMPIVSSLNLTAS